MSAYNRLAHGQKCDRHGKAASDVSLELDGARRVLVEIVVVLGHGQRARQHEDLVRPSAQRVTGGDVGAQGEASPIAVHGGQRDRHDVLGLDGRVEGPSSEPVVYLNPGG